MECLKKWITDAAGIALIIAVVCALPLPAMGLSDCDCSDTADPPFLAAGADPNLLLMIDNSASMYDLNYHDGTKESWECFDDSFDASNAYVGYFDATSWYIYNSATGRFEPTTAPSGAAENGGTVYLSKTGNDVSVEQWGSDAAGWKIALKATGNLLNWATASKFDIEKDILTGGKYDAAGQQWISEGRGCAGYRFIKQVSLSAGGTDYKLTMGVRADGDDGTAVENETTVIDIFKVTTSGFNYSLCKTAIDEVLFGTGNPQNAVGNCIDPLNQAKNPEKQVLIHSTTDCWKYWKGDLNNWPQHTTSLLGFCQDVYDSGLDPREILPTNSAYACYGDHDAATGYIGRCWIPSAAAAPCPKVECDDMPGRSGNDPYYRCNTGGDEDFVEYCAKNDYKHGDCQVAWKTYYAPGSCPDDPDAGWIGGYDGTGNIPAALETCMVDAMSAYCGATKVPQVVDPSDQQFSTGEVYNLPAILTDGGVGGQLEEPIARMNVVIKKADAAPEPEGLLQEFSKTIRFGAMAFNHLGSSTECGLVDADPVANPNVLYACNDVPNLDGAKVIAEIGSDTNTLMTEINNAKATSWTPLGEAMYTAIGYYTQKTSFRLNPSDFSTAAAPITSWCQSNNVLFITDGASTADLNAQMTGDAGSASMKDPDNVDSAAGTGELYGSTYFDDLAYFGRQKSIFDGSPYTFTETPKNINTFVVFTGQKVIDTNEGTPYTLMAEAVANGGPNALNEDVTDTPFEGENPEELEAALREAFRDILKRASAGSAASVIAATRGGEGAVYQAIFWPHLDDPAGNPEVTWAGEVHALLVDAKGNLYEDSNGDNALTEADQHVVFYFDETYNTTMACFGEVNAAGVCSGTVKDLDEVKYLWSAAEWLAGIGDADIELNRTTYISSEKKRYVFTWNDLNNNGAVDPGAGMDSFELRSFTAATDWAALPVTPAAGSPARAPVPYDFGATTDGEVDTIINWVRGKDNPADNTMRKREVPTPGNFDISGGPASITWRLGDIIHSTPTAVGRPAEAYHLLYRDSSYAEFVDHYLHRRQVVYFGGNDGLLHAVNGGFYNEDTNAFCVTADCAASTTAPELGAELWAYAPYNLLPHLHCLKDTTYAHKYFMDLKPRIFDVQIFTPDADHPQGWGTILVAGMRLGGVKTITNFPTDSREFISAYVILDITNPEKAPVLLGELTVDPATSADMAHSLSIPAVAPMKEGGTTRWYLVLGSGPTDLDGTSTQNAKIGVFPLDTLTTGSKVFRIPATTPSAGSEAGVYNLAGAANGMVSDIISVDYDLVEDYRADALYFGTIEGSWGGWDGSLFRWVTNADDHIQSPDGWLTPAPMFDPGRPITAAPAIGWDGDNFWVYFGTGRFLHKDDKTDTSSNAQETYYGIKEPLDCDGNFTWATVANTDALASPPTTGDLPGSRKLLRVDQIQVQQAVKAEDAVLSCVGGANCLPAGVVNFADLNEYIAGEGCIYDDATDAFLGYSGTDGWYMEFPGARERNLGQATLLGGLLTFTTYQPFDDVCRPEGESYLYGVYYQTGTAWHTSVFNTEIGLTGDDPPLVVERIDIGRGLASTPNLHVGREDGTKAFVQTSTGAIVEIRQPELPIKSVKSGRMSWRSD